LHDHHDSWVLGSPQRRGAWTSPSPFSAPGSAALLLAATIRVVRLPQGTLGFAFFSVWGMMKHVAVLYWSLVTGNFPVGNRSIPSFVL